MLRASPFDHGEARNGGMPDWLYSKPLPLRGNHPEYLKLVERLYRQIGRQVAGLLFADDGPVIGVQLENEYMQSGAPWEVSSNGGQGICSGCRSGKM